MSATGAQTARPATTATTKTPSASSRDITRVRSPGSARTSRTTTATRTRRRGTCSSHSHAERVSVQSAGSTPTGFDGESNPAGQSASGAAAGPRTNTQASTRRTCAEIRNATGSRQPREGSRPSGNSRSASTVHGTSSGGEAVDVPDRPAVARAGEARPHLGQRGSGEDRGHCQDEPPDRVARTRRREHRAGHSPQRRQQGGLPADLAAGLEPDRKGTEPGRRGQPGHGPGKERRPPRGPPAKRHGVSMRRATGHAADAGARLPARSSPRTATGAARGVPTSAAGSPRPGRRSPARRAPSRTRPSARQRP